MTYRLVIEGRLPGLNEYIDAERIILDWAAGHPEPQYPTWRAWRIATFPNAAVLCLRSFTGSCPSEKISCEACESQPIPADIAEKLGVKPIAKEE